MVFLSDIHNGLTGLGASIAVRVVNMNVDNVDKVRDHNDIKEDTSNHQVNNHDHIRCDDDIQIDHANQVLTTPVRVKFKDSVDHTPMERSSPLKPKKNKKANIKKPIEWRADPEEQRQGQKADCGEDFTSIEEEELMNCKFRDDALSGRHDRKTHLVWIQESYDLIMNKLHSHLDCSYLAIGLRGSSCISDWSPLIETP